MRSLFCFPLFLPVYLCMNVGLRGPPATTWWGLLAAACPALFHNPPPRWARQPPPCCKSFPPRLPVSTPPTGVDECFFFISLVDGLPCSSIFCQFWFFFVFKLLLSFFWLCEEVQCVYLHLHLGRKPLKSILKEKDVSMATESNPGWTTLDFSNKCLWKVRLPFWCWAAKMQT